MTEFGVRIALGARPETCTCSLWPADLRPLVSAWRPARHVLSVWYDTWIASSFRLLRLTRWCIWASPFTGAYGRTDRLLASRPESGKS